LAEVDAFNVGGVEEGRVEEAGGRFQAGAGVDEDGLPVVEMGILLQVEKEFGEGAVVQVVVFLELNFDEVGGLVALAVWGGENAINAEAGLFEFDGLEAVVGSIGLANQFKQNGGGSAEEAIKEGIGFHGTAEDSLDCLVV